MKKLLLSFSLTIFVFLADAQTTMYFKGEWTRMNKSELFTAVIKISIDAQGMAKGELLWTYVETDIADNAMVEHYKGKKGKQAIEFVEGTYSSSTHDIYFEGKNKTDPDDIIGMESEVRLESVGITVSLKDIYEMVEFPQPETGDTGSAFVEP